MTPENFYNSFFLLIRPAYGYTQERFSDLRRTRMRAQPSAVFLPQERNPLKNLNFPAKTQNPYLKPDFAVLISLPQHVKAKRQNVSRFLFFAGKIFIPFCARHRPAFTAFSR